MKDRRAHERFACERPVWLFDGQQGKVHNVSREGVYIEIARPWAGGPEIALILTLAERGGLQLLICQGRVMRREERGRRFGIAVYLKGCVLWGQDLQASIGIDSGAREADGRLNINT